ncbi:MAG: HAD family hydrolase [Clostridia bacterium]|nr:HAD family hydrolase [Clostridia bacterium]
MKYTTVIWDFNGTIMDDVALCMDSLNTMLKARGIRTVDTVAEYHKIFRFPIKEYYRLAGFDFEKETFEDLAVEWVNLYTAGEQTLTLSEGFLGVWQFIRDGGARQIILSASETEMLHRHLGILGIRDKFDGILGTGDIYAEGKVEMARRCLGTSLTDAVLIGDTTHDAETARAIGVDCILYAGGHASEAALTKTGAPVVSHLSELTALL